MDREPASVTFLPEGLTIAARAGDTILDAAIDHGVDLPHECGGNCACTTCHVRIESGAERLSPMEAVEEARLATSAARTPASRLACQALLTGGLVIVTPEEIW
ncbi:MAG TPA: 2Fe-2S iron-sulfur cluster-binding protein [Chthonomonadaceae bacterium]|nr:2Fe-2S iron-sulfur cluster-binding protein [Chthonomonadaceae bacterium]